MNVAKREREREGAKRVYIKKKIRVIEGGKNGEKVEKKGEEETR